jgi:hypothetical protein
VPGKNENFVYFIRKIKEGVLTELSIDPTNQFVDYGSQILVFFDILSTRYSNLHKNDLPNPFWVVTKEDFKSMQLLRYALDVIKTVDANHQLHTLELLLQHGNALLYLLLLQALFELLGIDTNGESPTSDYLALELNAIRRSGQTPTFVSWIL